MGREGRRVSWPGWRGGSGGRRAPVPGEHRPRRGAAGQAASVEGGFGPRSRCGSGIPGSAHPYASATELAEVRAVERGKDPHQVPYFDLTISAVKSVSVLHALPDLGPPGHQRGDQDRAVLDTRADELEAALMDSAREAVAWLERHATYTRTGHHSARAGGSGATVAG